MEKGLSSCVMKLCRVILIGIEALVLKRNKGKVVSLYSRLMTIVIVDKFMVQFEAKVESSGVSRILSVIFVFRSTEVVLIKHSSITTLCCT